MRWTALHRLAAIVARPELEESRDGQRYDDWSGYREVSFSSARRGFCGRRGHPKEADPWAGPRVLREAAPMSRGDRGLQLLALLGERTDCARPRCATAPRAVREALFEATEERRG